MFFQSKILLLVQLVTLWSAFSKKNQDPPIDTRGQMVDPVAPSSEVEPFRVFYDSELEEVWGEEWEKDWDTWSSNGREDNVWGDNNPFFPITEFTITTTCEADIAAMKDFLRQSSTQENQLVTPDNLKSTVESCFNELLAFLISFKPEIIQESSFEEIRRLHPLLLSFLEIESSKNLPLAFQDLLFVEINQLTAMILKAVGNKEEKIQLQYINMLLETAQKFPHNMKIIENTFSVSLDLVRSSPYLETKHRNTLRKLSKLCATHHQGSSQGRLASQVLNELTPKLWLLQIIYDYGEDLTDGIAILLERFAPNSGNVPCLMPSLLSALAGMLFLPLLKRVSSPPMGFFLGKMSMFRGRESGQEGPAMVASEDREPGVP